MELMQRTGTGMRFVRLAPAGCAILGLGWLLWLTFVQVFAAQWNAPRLAPAAALARGLEIYGTAESGPFLGWVYGPVFPLVFASIAWLPDQVMIHGAAWLLNLAVLAGPVWIVAQAGGKRPAAAALLAGGILALGTEAGRSAVGFIHVDLLCCGLGVLACAALERTVARGDFRGIPAAALATVLALGTKQVALALVAGLAGWLWWEGHRRVLVRYAAWLAVWGSLSAVAAGLWFGVDRLVFNLWTVHRHNPLAPDVAGLLAGQLGALARGLLPFAGLWIFLRMHRPSPGSVGVERALAWVAWAHLPLGLLAAVKVGGGLNSLHTLPYLWAWFVVRLARSLAAPPGRMSRTVGAVLAAAVLLAWTQGWLAGVHAGLPARPPLQRLRDEQTLARERPGRVYFPWNPLVTVLTERQVRPFDDALLCLDRCGLPARPAAVRAGIPRGALVVYPDPVQSTFALEYLRSGPP